MKVFLSTFFVLFLSFSPLCLDASTFRVNEQRQVLIDEKTWLMLGIYDAYPVEELKRIAELGFNAVECPHAFIDEKYLDEAEKLGLKVFPWFGMYNDSYVQTVKSFIEKYREHPALTGFFSIDEPANFDFDAKGLEKIYHELKELAPDLGIATAFNSIPKDAVYKDAVDVFCIDPYPIVDAGTPGGSVVTVAIETDLALKSTGNTKPVWAIPQAFGAYGSWKRAPTAAEYRCLNYLPLIHGAHGLFAYAHNMTRAKADCMMNSEELQKGARRTNKELAVLTPVLLNGNRSLIVNNRVHTGLYSYEKSLYLIIVNTSHRSLAPVFSSKAFNKVVVKNIFSKKPIEITEQSFPVELVAYAVEVIQIEGTDIKLQQISIDITGNCGLVENNHALGGKLSANSMLVDPESGLPAYSYFIDKANDGRQNTNWASSGEYKLPVWLQLDLPQSQKANRIMVSSNSAVFYDDWKDIKVEFSDGSSMKLTLADTPLSKPITFPTKTLSWVRITIGSTYRGEQPVYVGCSEFELYYDEQKSLKAADEQ
jgi:NedA-like, galactose-binding domain